MAKLKSGKFSAEEKEVILSAYHNGTSTETLAKLLNRSEKSIQKFIDNNTKESDVIPLATPKDPTTIPDPPAPLNPGYARKHFEIPDSKNPGQKRKGMAIMTEGGSEAGDKFLKEDIDGLLPMSSKHRDCIARAQND